MGWLPALSNTLFWLPPCVSAACASSGQSQSRSASCIPPHGTALTNTYRIQFGDFAAFSTDPPRFYYSCLLPLQPVHPTLQLRDPARDIVVQLQPFSPFLLLKLGLLWDALLAG